MTERIKKMAQDALNGIDKFDSGSTILKSDDELKDPLAIAQGICCFFESLQPQYQEGEKLFGRFRFFGCDYPSDFYRKAGHRYYSEYWEKFSYCSPTPRFYWGWTHLVLDFDFILKNGLKGYIELIDRQPMNNRLHEAMKVVLQGVGDLHKRFANTCSDKKLSYILRKVPMNPVATFYEAVQSVWSVFLLCPDSLGRIDQYLYPYYKRDIENGTVTVAEAAELLEELFVKVYESQMDNVALPISGHNHLVVGGYLEDGSDGFNELSKLVLECIAELPTFRPQASFRYTKYTTAETMKYITKLNSRRQWIVFVNDEPRIPGMQKIGIDYKDALNYTVVGCNEWCLPGNSKIDLAHVNILHPLEKLIYEDRRFVSAKSFEEVFSLYKEHLKEDILAIVDEYANYAAAQAKDINVLTSALCQSCIQSGKNISAQGTKYYGLTMSFNSISNIADSLSVIKQFVFVEKIFTLKELVQMLQNNYEGYEKERKFILSKGRFFGNDDDHADDIAKEVVNSVYEISRSVKRDYINILAVGSFVGATHPNIIFGKMTRATPDGRKNGDAFTMGITQSEGKDINGLTALLKSIAKLNYEKFCGCIVSNIKLDRTSANTCEKLEKLAYLYQTFLKMGGMQLQINYLSQKDLLEAQKKPDEYKNLVVRVTGYSGYFTRFDKDLQNDIIMRTVKNV